MLSKNTCHKFTLFLFVLLLVTLLGNTNPESVSAQAPDLTITTTIPIPSEILASFFEAIRSRPSNVLPGKEFVITSLDSKDNWAISTVALRPAAPDEGESILSNSVLIIANQSQGKWLSAIMETQEYEALLDKVPDLVIDANAKPFLRSSFATVPVTRGPLGVGTPLKWPWRSGQTWKYTQGRHGTNNSAIDLAPFTSIPGNERAVVAAASGVVIRRCDDSLQSNVAIRHSTGSSNDDITGYLHLDKNTVSLSHGSAINQGDTLGITYNSSIPNDPGTYPCGYSTGPHIHFYTGIIPAGSNNSSSITLIDIGGTVLSGWNLGTDNCFRKETETKCVNSDFTSDNGSGSCPGPSLNSPSDGFVSYSQTVNFSWSAPSGCTFEGYTFRVKDTSNMDSGGSTIIDEGQGGTSVSKTIDTQWNNRDLYWGVRTANPLSPNWSVRRFRIEPGSGGCNPDANQIALFENSNYGGTCKVFGIGEWADPGAMGFPNDSASSIKIGGNVKAILYRDNNYSGVSEEFTSDDSDLNDNSIGDNQVSSLKVQSRGSSSCSYDANQIILYEHPSYSGACKTLGIGDYANPGAMGFANDSASSIRVGGNVQAQLCSDDNFSGTCETFIGDDSDFGDNSIGHDRTSSVRVQTRPLVPPTLNSPSNGAIFNRSDNITLSWNSSSGATQYYAKFWGGPSLNLNSGWTANLSWSIGSQWGGSYQWRVKARNGSGAESGWSETRSLTIKYGAPSNLSFSVQSQTQINLTWSASADAPGNIDGYRIYRNGSAVNTVGNSTTSYNDSGLSCGAGYSYVVRAYKGSTESDASNSVAPMTLPCPFNKSSPSNEATGISTSPSLSWGISSGATSYEYCYNTSASCATNWTSTTNTSANLSGLSSGTTYYWQVRARNAGGTTDANSGTWWSFTTQSNIPATPANFRFTGVTQTSLTMAWDDVSNETGYKIYKWGEQGGVWDFYYLTSVGANATSYTDTTLACGISGFYQVSAYNGSGESARAGWIVKETLPCAPSNPNPSDGATVGRTTDITLSWNANGTSCDIHIWGGPNINTTRTGVSCGSFYWGQQWPGAYQWQVTVNNDSGSTTGSAWGLKIKPYAPTNLSASASRTQINLTWSASADAPGNIDGYRIYRDGAAVDTVGSSTTSYSDTNMSCGVPHNYEVRAYRGTIESDPSNSSAAATVCLPAAPSNLRVLTSSVTSITIQWDDNSNNESRFNIYKWKYDGTKWDFMYIGSVDRNVTTFTDTNLTCATTYYYDVAAYNVAGESSRAGWISAVTLACPSSQNPVYLPFIKK